MTEIPYGRQSIDDDDVEAVAAALRSDWLTTGPQVDGAAPLRCSQPDLCCSTQLWQTSETGSPSVRRHSMIRAAINARKPYCWIAHGACSRDEPQPKFLRASSTEACW